MFIELKNTYAHVHVNNITNIMRAVDLTTGRIQSVSIYLTDDQEFKVYDQEDIRHLLACIKSLTLKPSIISNKETRTYDQG